MSNNAAVCPDGSEIGRSQAMQAAAAGMSELYWPCRGDGVIPIFFGSLRLTISRLMSATILASAGRLGWLANHSLPRSPFSSPETHRNATLRAGFGLWPNASAISSSELVPDALSSEPL